MKFKDLPVKSVFKYQCGFWVKYDERFSYLLGSEPKIVREYNPELEVNTVRYFPYEVC